MSFAPPADAWWRFRRVPRARAARRRAVCADIPAASAAWALDAPAAWARIRALSLRWFLDMADFGRFWPIFGRFLPVREVWGVWEGRSAWPILAALRPFLAGLGGFGRLRGMAVFGRLWPFWAAFGRVAWRVASRPRGGKARACGAMRLFRHPGAGSARPVPARGYRVPGGGVDCPHGSQSWHADRQALHALSSAKPAAATPRRAGTGLRDPAHVCRGRRLQRERFYQIYLRMSMYTSIYILERKRPRTIYSYRKIVLTAVAPSFASAINSRGTMTPPTRHKVECPLLLFRWLFPLLTLSPLLVATQCLLETLIGRTHSSPGSLSTIAQDAQEQLDQGGQNHPSTESPAIRSLIVHRTPS